MKAYVLTALLFVFAGLFSLAHADQFTSTSYHMEDPVIAPSGYGTSTAFQLWGVVSQIATGTSSAASLSLNPGFLTYPFVSSPVVTASAGNAQVGLSWTASDGYLGWNVSGYSVGQSTSSGGPYTYTSLGNVNSTTLTGLTNGTPYYFVIVAKDGFDNFVATSTQVSVTPSGGNNNNGGGGGGGGGGGSVGPGGAAQTGVHFNGRAYPGSTVTILKDAAVAATTVAGPDATFDVTVDSLSVGNYIFSVYSEDNRGSRSTLISFPVSLTYGVVSNVTGMFIAPTILADKSEVLRGDNVVLFGQSAPESDIVIAVHSDEPYFAKTVSDKSGVYLYNFDSSVLEYGTHNAQSKAVIGNQLVSGFSAAVTFKVGTKNVYASGPRSCPAKGDVNGDCKVNLVDFSITAYWYKRALTGPFINTEKAKLSGDGKVDLKDFSIIAFNWTG